MSTGCSPNRKLNRWQVETKLLIQAAILLFELCMIMSKKSHVSDSTPESLSWPQDPVTSQSRFLIIARPRLRKPSKQSTKLSTLRIWHFIQLDLTCLWAYDILSYGCTTLTRLNVTLAPIPGSNILTLLPASIGQWT